MEKRKYSSTVVLGAETTFNGFLKFKKAVSIQGKFKGTIEAEGDLTIDKGAVVEADHINVNTIEVYGTLKASVHVQDKVDLFPGAEMRGDIIATRLRIADGVLYEGQCTMTTIDKSVEIFSRPTEEIKAELQRNYEQSDNFD
ncbi:MAG: polymer-forming cytoskeletal protein [Treponema sp.]|jgi:cytoskeletal protein CcmA (bactofilin family)|nr:polymer-forming cytoskeletal protein [Treponema sp.]